MRKLLVALLCVGLLVGCGDEYSSKSTIETETEEEQFELPYEISTDEGAIFLSNIYIEQDKTEYGYDGWIAFEFDYSKLDKDEQYWFEKENSIYFTDYSFLKTDDTVELNEFSEIESEIINDKKYIFWILNESREPLGEKRLMINIHVGNNEIEIDNLCSDFTIVDEFPDYIKQLLGELVWEKR